MTHYRPIARCRCSRKATRYRQGRHVCTRCDTTPTTAMGILPPMIISEEETSFPEFDTAALRVVA